MQFVKSSLYQAEITEGGVREREVDTRTKEQVELEERLRKLPEFSRSKVFHQRFKNVCQHSYLVANPLRGGVIHLHCLLEWYKL